MSGYQKFAKAYESKRGSVMKRSLRDNQIDEKQINTITGYLVDGNPLPGIDLCCESKYLRGYRWLSYVYMNNESGLSPPSVSRLLEACGKAGYVDAVCWTLGKYKPNDHDIEAGFRSACRAGNLEVAKSLYCYAEQLESKRPDMWLIGEYEDLDINECFRSCCQSNKSGTYDVAVWLCGLRDMDHNLGFKDLCSSGKQHMIGITGGLYGLTDEKLDINQCFRECWRNQYIGLDIGKWIHKKFPDISFTLGTFYDVCRYHDLQTYEWMLKEIDIKIDFDRAFLSSCENQNIDIAKHILEIINVNVNDLAYRGFLKGCSTANLAICKWLYEIASFDPFGNKGEAIREGLEIQGFDEFTDWLLGLSRTSLYTHQNMWAQILGYRDRRDIRYVVQQFIQHNKALDLSQISNKEFREKLAEETDYLGHVKDCLLRHLDKGTVSCIQNLAV